MMEEMKSKAEAEKEAEIKLYKEYMSWCAFCLRTVLT